VAAINRSAGGVPKRGVPFARVTAEGVEGDVQRDRRHHGGPDRAVCLFSLERINALRAEGHPIGTGTTGENVTVAGLDWDRVTPGVRLALGAVELEITSYAAPCETIVDSFSDKRSTRISQKVHPGWSRVYARVLTEGRLAAGDTVAIIG
jgi:MOSC domain-containing protein YiiM